jgi:exodeoxyribonuclease VII small subunit
MPKKPPATNQDQAISGLSFEQATMELQQLVVQMEAGDLPLEASIAAYKRGSELVKYCAEQLDKVEHQIKILEDDMLKPFSVQGEEFKE